MTSRRTAPRRLVEDVVRAGGYGGTLWHHFLECGHVDARKRRAPTPYIGCVLCGTAAAPVEDQERRRLRATYRLAELLEVGPDEVEVTMDDRGVPLYARVWLQTLDL